MIHVRACSNKIPGLVIYPECGNPSNTFKQSIDRQSFIKRIVIEHMLESEAQLSQSDYKILKYHFYFKTRRRTWMPLPPGRTAVTLTFHLWPPELIRSSIGAVEYSLIVSSTLLQPFMRYRGNKICTNERTNSVSEGITINSAFTMAVWCIHHSFKSRLPILFNTIKNNDKQDATTLSDVRPMPPPGELDPSSLILAYCLHYNETWCHP